jgi:phenylacetyl-CoA:acceptor oxidoreductase subunit 2
MVLLVGNLLPAILFLTVMTISPTSPAWLLGIGGGFAVIGGAFWKATVITRACHQQGFALARYPQRGSGTFAAPRLGGK